MSITKSVQRLVVLAAFAALVAACGGSDSSSTYKEPTGPAATTLKVESGNLFFRPDKLTAAPGIIAIQLTNIESGVHDLVIKGQPGFQVEVTGSGDTATSKIDLKKGKYTFYCSIPGHEAAGMKGTLTVS